jgi:hypothetical protein
VGISPFGGGAETAMAGLPELTLPELAGLPELSCTATGATKAVAASANTEVFSASPDDGVLAFAGLLVCPFVEEFVAPFASGSFELALEAGAPAPDPVSCPIDESTPGANCAPRASERIPAAGAALLFSTCARGLASVAAPEAARVDSASDDETGSGPTRGACNVATTALNGAEFAGSALPVEEDGCSPPRAAGVCGTAGEDGNAAPVSGGMLDAGEIVVPDETDADPGSG